MKHFRLILTFIVTTFAFGASEAKAQVDLINSKGKVIETKKLLECHVDCDIVPLEVKIQSVDNGIFTLSMPVNVANAIDEYPEGRKMQITDKMGNVLCHFVNGVTVAAGKNGLESESLFMSERIYSGNSVDFSEQNSEANEYYCHPRFVITQEQLEFLRDKAQDVQRIEVAKSNGKGFWYYYPTVKFQKEIVRILGKMNK